MVVAGAIDLGLLIATMGRSVPLTCLELSLIPRTRMGGILGSPAIYGSPGLGCMLVGQKNWPGLMQDKLWVYYLNPDSAMGKAQWLGQHPVFVVIVG